MGSCRSTTNINKLTQSWCRTKVQSFSKMLSQQWQRLQNNFNLKSHSIKSIWANSVQKGKNNSKKYSLSSKTVAKKRRTWTNTSLVLKRQQICHMINSLKIGLSSYTLVTAKANSHVNLTLLTLTTARNSSQSRMKTDGTILKRLRSNPTGPTLLKPKMNFSADGSKSLDGTTGHRSYHWRSRSWSLSSSARSTRFLILSLAGR